MNGLEPITIEPDIKKASTLPTTFYNNPLYYELSKEKVFARSWQWAADSDNVKLAGSVYPFILLENALNEPLVLTRTEQDELFCLSNVCTHRGNLVALHPCQAKQLQCKYHGKRFSLDGKFIHITEFREAENFPSSEDNLTQLPLGRLGKMLFTALHPPCSFEAWIAPVIERLGWLPWEEFYFDAASSKEYGVQAHWALYCDNYLEGFHIPFVHPLLNQTLSYEEYETHLFEWSNLQIGAAKNAEVCFALPSDSPDYGKNIAGYYFWLYPNLMLNFYPWGLSVNLVRPLGPQRCKVSFYTYLWRPELRGYGAGAALDLVEREDEAVVETVQRGIQSRLYRKGRYSPSKEQCVHHFHQLLTRQLFS
jgi:choline monooxygenase